MRTVTQSELANYLLKKNLIEFTFTPEDEDISPESAEKLYRYAEGFAEGVRDNMNKDYDWGWCTVKCTGSINGVTSDNYLGGCSYESHDDFVNNSGYADYMKQTVANDLAGGLLPIIHVLAPLFEQEPV